MLPLQTLALAPPTAKIKIKSYVVIQPLHDAARRADLRLRRTARDDAEADASRGINGPGHLLRPQDRDADRGRRTRDEVDPDRNRSREASVARGDGDDGQPASVRALEVFLIVFYVFLFLES